METRNVPLHTRFRLSPSGGVHIGHAALALLSYEAARVTGGTFTLRCESLKPSRCTSRWANYKRCAQQNIDDLIALGLEPSPVRAFLSFADMSPNWRIEYTDDRNLVDYYWRELGCRDLWGEWPYGDDEENDWHSYILGYYCQGWPHPYKMMAQTVGDVCTRRNCLIRGADHLHEAAWFNAYAQAIARRHFDRGQWDHAAEYVATQWFLPKLVRDSGLPLSSSNPDETTGFYVKDFLETGIPPERLFQFIGKTLFGSVEASACMYRDWSFEPVGEVPEGFWDSQFPDRFETHYGPRRVFDCIVERPVIHDEDWRRFLRTGEVGA